MRPAVDVVTTLRYRFVRYCVNKAYAEMELQAVPAEVVNVFDDVVSQIRDLEKYFTSLDSVARTLRVDLPERLKVLKERDPALAGAFVRSWWSTASSWRRSPIRGLRTTSGSC